MQTFFIVLLAYVLGSIPFGLLIARWFGKMDIRQFGSGNIGATNVGRAMGFQWFVAVFVCDALKGMLPTLLTVQLQMRDSSLWDGTGVLAGAMAVIGHMFPCWLNFRGGKGVATALGVIIILAPWGTLVGAIVFFSSFALARMVSLSSILAALAFGITQFCLFFVFHKESNIPLLAFSVVVPLLIIIQHRTNIVRILRGEEHRFIRQSKTGEQAQAGTSGMETKESH